MLLSITNSEKHQYIKEETPSKLFCKREEVCGLIVILCKKFFYLNFTFS